MTMIQRMMQFEYVRSSWKRPRDTHEIIDPLMDRRYPRLDSDAYIKNYHIILGLFYSYVSYKKKIYLAPSVVWLRRRIAITSRHGHICNISYGYKYYRFSISNKFIVVIHRHVIL